MKSAHFKIHFLIITLSAVIFAGCQAVVGPVVVEKTFKGYPCNGTCTQFEQGFNIAQEKDFTSDSQCDTIQKPLRLGCLTYLHEYRLENNQPAGYLFE
jgi:hypothetical protein